MAERRARLSFAEVTKFIAFLSELPISIERINPGSAFGQVLLVAREQGLSVCDASYLDLALRRGLPVATKDSTLREAVARVGVEIFKGGEPG